MLRISLRNLLANKGRFLMTTFAVVLGVAFVVGSFVVTDTVRTSVEGLFTEIGSGTDVTVRAASELDSVGGPASRGKIPEELLEVVRAVEGVEVAEGTVGGYAQMLTPDGDPVETTGAPFLGVSWGEDDRLYPVTLDEGEKPQGPDEVAVDRDTAEEYGLVPGTETTVQLIEGPRPVTVTGVFTFGETNSLLGARLTAFETEAAQDAFGSEGTFDTIEVGAAEGVDAVALADLLQTALPDGVEAITQEEVVDESVDQLDQFIGIFQTVLLVFAGVSMFVAAFSINNTFAIVLGQRVRQLALLRALGASGAQIRRSVALEALIIGVLASIIGIGAGLLVAIGIQQLLASGGFELPDSGTELAGRTIIAALVVGVVVTVAASILPARRAATIEPVEGMREGVLHVPGAGRRRLVFGGVLTLLGIVAMFLGLFVIDDTGTLFLFLGVGAVAVFVGVSWLSPLFAVPSSWAIGWPFARVGISGRIARENAARNPTRTARTASALMIGLALVSMVFVVGTSIKDSVAAAVEGSVRADFIISTESFTGFSPAVSEQVEALPEIEVASGVRFDRAIVEGDSVDLSGFRAPEGEALLDIDLQAGSWDNAGDDGIFIHVDEAEDRGLAVDDPIAVQFAEGGPQQFRVAGIYGDATFAGNFWIPLDTFARSYPAVTTDFLVFARTADGADAGAARDAVEAVLEPYPQLTLEDTAEFRQSQEDQLNQVLVAVNGLLFLAVVIALLGIANTLALSVLERTREIGLLRAVGMGRRQTRGMVLLEAVIVAVFGAILGIVIGVLFGIGASSALPDSVITTVTVPWGSLVVVVAVAAVAGVLAGFFPARRAARMDVLQAISTE